MRLFDVDEVRLDKLLKPRANVFRRVPSQDIDAVVGGALQRLGDRGLYLELGKTLDFPSYAASSLASQCGERAVDAVRGCMNSQPEPSAWFGALSPFLQGKKVVVSVRDDYVRDSELSAVVSEDWSWRDWVTQCDAIVVRSIFHRKQAPRWVEPHPSDVVSEKAIWHAVGCNTHRYTMALAHEVLIGQLPRGKVLRSTSALATRLWQELPGELSELVSLLAVNERPVTKADMVSLNLVKPEIYDWALQSHLVEERAGFAVLPRGLATRAKPEVPVRQHAVWAQAYERALATEHFDPVIATTEACRHYAALLQPEKAFEFARFGLGVALEMAINLSRADQYEAAADSYQQILKLAEQLPNRRRLHGYAKHYLHYNRYKAGQEALPETISGYAASLNYWPENALFHSRQVRALVHDGQPDKALQAFDNAWHSVQSPEESSRYLVDRLVRRLLQRRMVIPALAILERLPSGRTADAVLERLVDRATEAGWQCSTLWIPGVLGLHLDREVTASVNKQADGKYRAIVDSHVHQDTNRFKALIGATREAAFNQLAWTWVNETSHLSSRQAKFDHPAYIRIMSIGSAVIPSVLRWIQRGGRGHWDRALDALAPSRPAQLTGPLSNVMQQWVEWGVLHNLIGESGDVHRLG